MNLALFRSTLKTNVPVITSYAIGMAAYEWLFIGVYPSLAKSSAFNNLLQSLPQGLLQLVGYQAGVSQIGDFLAGEYYGLMYVILLAIYTITTATKLVARQVDNGSMAYLLSTPVTRTQVALTQAAVLLAGIAVIGGVTAIAGLAGVHWFIHGPGLQTTRFMEMNVTGMLLFCVIGAYSFLFSCVAPDARTAVGLSASLTIVFYALKTVSVLNEHLAWLRHLSLFTAFQPQELMHGHGHFTSTALWLAVAAVALFLAAAGEFRQRQMSL